MCFYTHLFLEITGSKWILAGNGNFRDFFFSFEGLHFQGIRWMTTTVLFGHQRNRRNNRFSVYLSTSPDTNNVRGKNLNERFKLKEKKGIFRDNPDISSISCGFYNKPE